MRKPAVDIAVSSDYDPTGCLRSLLGIMLFRCWLYDGSLPFYQAASLIEQGRPLYIEREGFTQYYR